MGDYNRSKSYGGSGTMQMETYYGAPRAPPPPTSYELTSYSASYAQAQMGNYPYNYNNRDLKKGKTATVSRSKSSSWALSDPELQRKKRVATYKMYAVEGKMKGSFRKSFRWLKAFWLIYTGRLILVRIAHSLPKFPVKVLQSLAVTPEYLRAVEAIRSIVKKMDPKLEVNIKEATKLIAEMSQDKLRFKYTLQQKIDDASSLESWLRYLNAQKDCLKYLLITERKKMDLLQLLLDRFRGADNTYPKKSIKECLSAQEMNNHKLHFQMVHGSKSLTKEKQLLKDMKLSQQEDKFVTFWTQLEHDLEMQLRKVILKPLLITMESTELWNCKASDYDAMVKNNVNANAAWKGIISSSSGLKKALQEKVKVASERIEEIRKTQVALGLGKIISQVRRESEAMKRGIDSWRKRFPNQIVYGSVRSHSNAYLRCKRLESLSHYKYDYY